MAETEQKEGQEVASGTAPNGTAVKVYMENGLQVVRDEKGNRLTHSDTLEGLEGAGFKFSKSEANVEETMPATGSAPAASASKGKGKSKK